MFHSMNKVERFEMASRCLRSACRAKRVGNEYGAQAWLAAAKRWFADAVAATI